MKKSGILVLLVICLISCKKSSESGYGKNGDNLGEKKDAVLVYSASKFNDATDFKASFDGKYMTITTKQNDKVSQYSNDGGETWKDLPAKVFPTQINNNGYITYFDSSISRNVVSKADQTTLNFSFTSNQGDEFYLGNSQYIYHHKVWQKGLSVIDANTGATTPLILPSNSFYCGPDQNGGIAFVNSNGLDIHQPITNTWKHYDINIGTERLLNRGWNKPSVCHYNGFDKLVIGNDLSYSVYSLNSANAIEEQDWPYGMKGNYTNPMMLKINKEGAVYTTISQFGGKPRNFKINLSNFTEMSELGYNYTSGNFSYEFTDTEAKKIGAQTTLINGVMKNQKKMINAFATDDKVYALYNLTYGEPDYYNGDKSPQVNMLSIYDQNAKTETFVEKTGLYNFVYADGNNILITGPDSLTFSNNGGNTWSRKYSPLTSFIRELKKIGNTYYAMYVKLVEYNSPGNGPIIYHDYKMLTSTDLQNWKVLPGTAHDGNAAIGPRTFTSDGYLSFTYGEKQYSKDFGKTWNKTTENIVIFFDVEIAKDQVATFNNDGTEFHKTVNSISKGDPSAGKTVATYISPVKTNVTPLRAPILSKSNKIYFFGDLSVIRFD